VLGCEGVVLELREELVVLGGGRLEEDILLRLDGLVGNDWRKGVVSWIMVRIREEKRFMQWCYEFCLCGREKGWSSSLLF